MKGEIAIQTVGKIVLVIMVLALVFLAFESNFTEVLGTFSGSISYPQP